jgi:hypothetical protein
MDLQAFNHFPHWNGAVSLHRDFEVTAGVQGVMLKPSIQIARRAITVDPSAP